MINFNFYKGSLDFIKKIGAKNIFITFAYLVLIGLAFKDNIKDYITKKDHKDIFSNNINKTLELEYILNDIVKTYDIDYLNVNLFHNGTVTPSGYHFTKMSCIAEGLKPGKLPRIQNLQNWVIEPFLEKIAEVKRKGYVYISDLSTDHDPYFNTTIPKFGIKSVFYVGLFDRTKKDKKGNYHFIGFISYGWEKPTKLDEKNLVSMMREKDRITEFIIKK
jgi:hypothetical protein